MSKLRAYSTTSIKFATLGDAQTPSLVIELPPTDVDLDKTLADRPDKGPI